MACGLGDVARREVLLARSAELDVAARVAEARVAMTDAERTYRSVTGLDRRPVTRVETLSTLATIDASHPALQLATAAVEGARAARGVVRESGITSPTLMIGPRRERSVFGQDFEDSIGIFVTVPFGGRSHIDTQVTAAGRLVAAREAELRAMKPSACLINVARGAIVDEQALIRALEARLAALETLAGGK